MWWQPAAAVLGGIAILWLALVVALYARARKEGDPARLTDALRLLPDLVRLLRRLSADPSLPRGVRIKMALLVGYLVTPIDLVPTSSRSSGTPTTRSSSPSRSGR